MITQVKNKLENTSNYLKTMLQGQPARPVGVAVLNVDRGPPQSLLTGKLRPPPGLPSSPTRGTGLAAFWTSGPPGYI